MRHAITKLSHLHFVSTEEYAARVRQLGEEDWRVVVSGAPALDALVGFRAARRERARGAVRRLVRATDATRHVPSRDARAGADRGRTRGAVIAAVRDSGLDAVFTYPNADTGNRGGSSSCSRRRRASNDRYSIVRNFGSAAYFSVAEPGRGDGRQLLVGPARGSVVSPAGRQRRLAPAGRVRAANVIDVEAGAGARSPTAIARGDLAGVPREASTGSSIRTATGTLLRGLSRC